VGGDEAAAVHLDALYGRLVADLHAQLLRAAVVRIIESASLNLKYPFGLSLSKPFDKLRANGICFYF